MAFLAVYTLAIMGMGYSEGTNSTPGWKCPCQDACDLKHLRANSLRLDLELRRLHSKVKKLIKITLNGLKRKYRMNKLYMKYKGALEFRNQMQGHLFPSVDIPQLSQTATKDWIYMLNKGLQTYAFYFYSFNQTLTEQTKIIKMKFVIHQTFEILCLVEVQMANMGMPPSPTIEETHMNFNEKLFLWLTLHYYGKYLRAWRKALASPTHWTE